MKTIGLICGMSWESSAEYYRIINEAVLKRLGGVHSAKICMISVDYAEIDSLLKEQNWGKISSILSDAAQKLSMCGADFILICTNTMHMVADEIQAKLSVPILHIADAAGRAVKKQGFEKVALLGTKYTMQEDFYKDRLTRLHHLSILIPDGPDQDLLDRIIFEELVIGKIEQNSRDLYKEVIRKMVNKGAQGIILGCTEIGLLVKSSDSPVPLFDTTEIHALAAVEDAL